MRRSSLRRPESLTDKYRILGKIGEGTYGMVFKAEAYSSALLPRPSSAGAGSANAGEDEEPMTFAIKLVKSHKEGKNDVVLSSATIREIKLLRELHHDNVVHLHDVHVDPREKTLALVFEYGDHDLHDIIVQSKQKPLGEYTRKSLMYQILKGVDYMHDAWVMHRDMKPQNILVVGHGRKRGQVKLADFGLARIYREPIKALTDVERVVVTLWYRAPELLLGAKHYTKAVDLWAVGCIFAELINTRELFCGKEVEGSNAPFQKDQLDKIFKVLGLPTPQTWEGLEHLPEYPHVMQMARERKYPSTSELKNAVKFGPGRAGAALYDLIARLLEYDPEKRITAKDALEHEYFKEIEPEPRDWAFDEPGKEPVSFRTQNVEAVAEDQLPWKARKDGAAAGDNAGNAGSPSQRDGSKAGHHQAAGSAHDPNSRASRDARSRSNHSASREPAPRRSERQQQQQQQQHTGNSIMGAPPSGANPVGDDRRSGSAWRDRSAARSSGAPVLSSAPAPAAGKRPGGPSGSERPPSAGASTAGAERSTAGNSNRPRSPKQQRRR